MNAGILLVMSGVNTLPPGMPVWAITGIGNDTEAITNPNDYPLQVTLANPWVNTNFTWSSPGVVTIPAHGSANVTVHCSASLGGNGTCNVPWSVTGGRSGNVTASASDN